MKLLLIVLIAQVCMGMRPAGPPGVPAAGPGVGGAGAPGGGAGGAGGGGRPGGPPGAGGRGGTALNPATSPDQLTREEIATIRRALGQGQLTTNLDNSNRGLEPAGNQENDDRITRDDTPPQKPTETGCITAGALTMCCGKMPVLPNTEWCCGDLPVDPNAHSEQCCLIGTACKYQVPVLKNTMCCGAILATTAMKCCRGDVWNFPFPRAQACPKDRRQ